MRQRSLQLSSPPGFQTGSQQLSFPFRCVGSCWASWHPFCPLGEESWKQNGFQISNTLSQLSFLFLPLSSSQDPTWEDILPTTVFSITLETSAWRWRSNLKISKSKSPPKIWNKHFPHQNGTYHRDSQQRTHLQDALNQHKPFPLPWFLRRSQEQPKSDTVLGQPMPCERCTHVCIQLQEIVFPRAFICFSVCTYIHTYRYIYMCSTPFPVNGRWWGNGCLAARKRWHTWRCRNICEFGGCAEHLWEKN